MGVLGLLEGLCTVLAASSPWSAEDMRQRVQLADAFHVDTSPRARAARKDLSIPGKSHAQLEDDDADQENIAPDDDQPGYGDPTEDPRHWWQH